MLRLGRVPGLPALVGAGLLALAVAVPAPRLAAAAAAQPAAPAAQPAAPVAQPAAPVAQPAAPAAQPAAPAAQPAASAPRAYLIYLIDGQDPIVVTRYVEEGDQIRFEKYGGWVGIARYEVLRIVPDEPGAREMPLSPVPAAPLPAEAPLPEEPSPAPEGPGDRAYVALRGGISVRGDTVTADATRVRVSAAEGSLTFPRADLVGVLRLPAGAATPEAWITLIERRAAVPETVTPDAALASDPAPPAMPPGPSLPPISNRPHLLQVGPGAPIRVDGFWIEDGQIRFHRLGGVVGFALSEVVRLLPAEPAVVGARVAGRFVRRLSGDRLEVRLDHGIQPIQLIGVEPRAGRPGADDPWATLRPGQEVRLEFDRQRYAPDGEWLAYLYLPSGRMLNAELIRAGLARPRLDAENVRHLDLFHEIWSRRPDPGGPAD